MVLGSRNLLPSSGQVLLGRPIIRSLGSTGQAVSRIAVLCGRFFCQCVAGISTACVIGGECGECGQGCASSAAHERPYQCY